MKITRVSAYQVDLPFDHGTYKLSGGRTWTSLDSTIVRIDTDAGITGWGETCPFGPNYVEAFAEGARAGIKLLAPDLLGLDPSQPAAVCYQMDRLMLGHPYVKHGIDMACWDIMGKSAGMPLYRLMGGMRTPSPRTSGWIPPETGERMDELLAHHRANNTRMFSTKASGNAEKDMAFLDELASLMQTGESVKVDANGGWRVDEAIRIMNHSRALDAYFEQPCETYEECRTVYQATGRPQTLDETALTLQDIVRAFNDGVCHSLNLKIGRVGGLTPALAIRNTCSALGIPMHIQCAGGNQLTQAAIVHLAHSTPTNRLLYIWDIGDVVSFSTVTNPLRDDAGTMVAHDAPGLGVEVDESVIGEPVFEID